jgi:hypothetical protein
MILDFSKSKLFIILLLTSDFNKKHLNITKSHFNSIPTGWSITLRSLQLINNEPKLLFKSYLDYIKKSKNATMHAIYGNRVKKVVTILFILTRVTLTSLQKLTISNYVQKNSIWMCCILLKPIFNIKK